MGFAAFVLLIPLAVTSPQAMVRKLGRRWQTLHRSIYAIAVLAILHFWWMKAGKHDLDLAEDLRRDRGGVAGVAGDRVAALADDASTRGLADP